MSTIFFFFSPKLIFKTLFYYSLDLMFKYEFQAWIFFFQVLNIFSLKTVLFFSSEIYISKNNFNFKYIFSAWLNKRIFFKIWHVLCSHACLKAIVVKVYEDSVRWSSKSMFFSQFDQLFLTLTWYRKFEVRKIKLYKFIIVR